MLVIRDGYGLRYVWGALDRDARPPHTTSPSSLIHWVAMREGYDAGIEVYDLGPGSPESVAEFKLRFDPDRIEIDAVSIPTSRLRFVFRSV